MDWINGKARGETASGTVGYIPHQLRGSTRVEGRVTGWSTSSVDATKKPMRGWRCVQDGNRIERGPGPGRDVEEVVPGFCEVDICDDVGGRYCGAGWSLNCGFR